MNLLRIYLLAGLVLHKLVWEVLKWRIARHGPGRRTAGSPRQTLVKTVKVGILLAIVVQTMLPDVLPITQEPTTIRFIGVALFTAGLLMAITGRLQLADNWSDIEAAKVLRNQAVVSRGLYRYIRHPIYVGDLLLLIGLELSLNSWLVLGVGLMMPVVLLQAVREEKMLAAALPGYDSYRVRTKRFIPFVV